MLSDEQIIEKAHEAGLYQDGINTQLPLWVLTQQELERFARAIEADVRKQDDALIQQLLESMCWAARVMAISEDEAPGYFAATTAARTRLGEKT